jgi:hypothetical protein
MNLDGQGLSPTALSSRNRICGATSTNISRMMSTYLLTKVSLLLLYLIKAAKHFLGYPLTKYSIQPFSDFDLTNDNAEAADHKQWNVSLSRLHVAVENAFGRLKGRFLSLRNLPGHNIDEMFRTIEALLIVHNIVEEFGNDPETILASMGKKMQMWVMSFMVRPLGLEMMSYIGQDLLDENLLLDLSRKI